MNKNSKGEKNKDTGVETIEMNENTLTEALGIGLGGVYGYFTELEYKFFFVLLILMICDIVVGVLFAMYNGSFRSYSMREGIIGKLLSLILLLALTVFQFMLNEYGIMPPFANVVAGVLGFMEVMSILETFTKNGVEIPNFIVGWFDEKYKEINREEE